DFPRRRHARACPTSQQLEQDRRDSPAHHAELARCPERKVEAAAADVGSAVGDRHEDRATVAQVRHPYLGAQRQGTGRGGQLLGPEGGPAGGPPPGESIAVVRRAPEARLRIFVRSEVRPHHGGAEARTERQYKKNGPGDRSPGPYGHGLHDPAPCTPTKLADGFGTKSLPVSDATRAARDSPHTLGPPLPSLGDSASRFCESRRGLLNQGAPVKPAARRTQ